MASPLLVRSNQASCYGAKGDFVVLHNEDAGTGSVTAGTVAAAQNKCN